MKTLFSTAVILGLLTLFGCGEEASKDETSKEKLSEKQFKGASNATTMNAISMAIGEYEAMAG